VSETIAFFQKGLLIVVWLSLPAMIVAVVVGVVTSLIQTVLSVQDQALPFAFKLLAVGLTMAIVGRWIGLEILALGEQAFQSIAGMTNRQ
jgi:type III secretion protein S